MKRANRDIVLKDQYHGKFPRWIGASYLTLKTQIIDR